MKFLPNFFRRHLGADVCARLLGTAVVLWISAAARAAAPLSEAAERTTFTHSIASVPTTAADANGRLNRAYVSRATLTANETAAPMTFEVALAMRNFDELEARLAHSEIISPEEMAARYLPLAVEHDRVLRWLKDEGMTVTRTDANHLAIFARSSVAEVGRVFQTRFARVTAKEGEFTSAVEAPSVPTQFAKTIRGIHGLQPQRRLHLHPRAVMHPQAGAGGSSLPYFPAQIAKAYNAGNLTQTGAGQTIAIYGFVYPLASDLASFWSVTGSSASATNMQNVDVGTGPVDPSTLTTSTARQQHDDLREEATLDVEWASALAPGATIRFYGANEQDPVADDELIQKVLADLPTQPTLHQLTISFGSDETGADGSDRDYIAIEAQYMAALVSSGVTVFASSGDSGAAGNDPSTIQVGYPASMPDVTAVGGTTLNLNSNGTIATETGWGSITDTGANSGASGGGISAVFSRPTWQTGAGVPAGNFRLVPDVAAVGDPNTGGMVLFNGIQEQIGGTSLSSPIWAAFCALFNEARATAGKPPLGALNPRIYPLANAGGAFRDIVSGGNSKYLAGPGYDLVTGLGSPGVATLMQSFTSDNFAPVIEVQSGNRFTTVAQSATFYIIATSNPNPSYRWQRLAAGTSGWVDLADNATYSGSSTYTLAVNGATLAMSGDQFRCIVSNNLSSVTGDAATLTVQVGGVSTLAGWPGWSGFADGRGAAGRFNYTGSVRVDAAGTVYVADASNGTVRKVTPDGVVTTLAGAPEVFGSTDGPGSVARFHGPAGVAIDSTGNVFVADAENYTIRKITPAGIVSTLAGSPGVQGHADGTGSAATFSDPENLTIDLAGNLYIADGSGNTVRKVTPAGVVTTLAGSATGGRTDGTGSAARFNLLAGIAVDSNGNVYVGDFLNNSVRKITPAGVVTTLAGSTNGRSGSTDGIGTAARFSGPTGLAVDAAGNVYVADQNNNAIRKITPAGVVTTVAGSANVAENIDGPLDVARFNGPADVAFDPAGNLYVADALNCTVRRISFATGSVPVIAFAPRSQAVGLGGGLVLTVAASGDGPFTYQWSKDGLPIAGATSATYSVSAATAATAGSYTVAVTGSGGTTASAPAVITTAPAVPALLSNLSVQTIAGGARTLTVGFVLSGSGNKTVLVRGVGPGLSAFGLAGLLADPKLTLFGPNSSTNVAASNDNWSTNVPDITATFTATGAFPLVRNSNDAALVTTLAAGNYTAQVTGAAPGQALAEIYDTAIGSGAKLINLSTLAQVDSGGTLIAGFTISGNVAKTVLIRGAGPALTSLGVGGALVDPKLELYDSSNNLLQTNDDWGATPALIAAFGQTGAFSFGNAPTKDAALLVTLPPGGYTALVRGVNGASGLAIVEIYEVP